MVGVARLSHFCQTVIPIHYLHTSQLLCQGGGVESEPNDLPLCAHCTVSSCLSKGLHAIWSVYLHVQLSRQIYGVYVKPIVPMYPPKTE